MKKKISIIGAGAVGSALAQRVLEKNYADVILLDIVPGMPQGKALDMQQAGVLLEYDSKIVGTNDYVDTANSDIVVITSGLPRNPNMNTRNILLKKNQEIITDVTKKVVKYSPNCIIIMVTNPLNPMAQLALSVSKFPRSRVIGMAGILDTARLQSFIAQELNVSTQDIQALVLGEHGDLMVPVISTCTVAGNPLKKLLSTQKIEQIVKRTRDGGAEIISLSGATYFAPSAAVLQMINAIILDTKIILPCAAYLQGEYGIHNLFVGVPVKLGTEGIEQIVETPLDKNEQMLLQKSAKIIKEQVNLL